MRCHLLPEESQINGEWIFDGTRVVEDEKCRRIMYLVRNVLRRVAESPRSGSWEVLYQDPADGRYWELTYPNGDMQGGGPPRLAVISPADARRKYMRCLVEEASPAASEAHGEGQE